MSRLSSNEEKIRAQNNMINTLRMDNAEMARGFRSLEEELSRWKAKADDLDKSKQKMTRELTMAKKQVKDRESEVTRLRAELGHSSPFGKKNGDEYNTTNFPSDISLVAARRVSLPPNYKRKTS
jgi:chromosome segregation ATPase